MTRRSLRPWLWMAAGFVPGLALALGLAIGQSFDEAPDEPMFRGMPVRAFGADSGATYGMATGPIDGETEGIFAIDYLTGDLYCWVYYPRVGQFGAQYTYNVTADLKSEQGKTPSYVMVTGASDIRGPGGQQTFAQCIVYVADANTGNVAAYTVPWERGLASQGAPQQATFARIGLFKGRNTVIRE